MTLFDCPWPDAPAQPVLFPDEVHVWCASLDQSCQVFEGFLSFDEKDRAKRFRFEKDRDRFIVGRGLLRNILSFYLDYPPEALQFLCGPYGKPALFNNINSKKICFNLAHSGDLILIAVTIDRPIGIDIERIQLISNVEQLVGQYFSQTEIDEYATISTDQKLGSFFSAWTRKEAYLKARGEGLSFPLDQFSVSMTPENPERPVKIYDNKGDVFSEWFILSFDPAPAPGYVGALGVTGDDWKLVKWRMQNNC